MKPMDVSLEKELESLTDSLVIVLDGVSKNTFDFFYNDNYLPNIHKYFNGYPTSNVISTFPALTKPAHCAFLGLDEPKGYEALSFDRENNKYHFSYPRNIFLRDLIGIDIPGSISNEYDYSKETIRHMLTFLHPELLIRGDLTKVRKTVDNLKQSHNSIWFLGTDELTHRKGLKGQAYALREIDNTFPSIINSLRPKELLLFSDHGNSISDDKLQRANLEQTILQAGFNISKRLVKEKDVVLPRFGLISFAAIYTFPSNVNKLTPFLMQNESVDLVIYRDDDEKIVVENLVGKAIISTKTSLLNFSSKRKYSYECLVGDPLGHQPIYDQLEEAGHLDRNGFVDEKELLEFSKDDELPYAIPRIYGAFYHNHSPADILLSLKNGYHNGSRKLERLVDIYSTHGNLTKSSSVGFALYNGPKEMPSHQEISNLQGCSHKKENNPPRKLLAIYHKVVDAVREQLGPSFLL